MKTTIILATGTTLLTLSACKNPADKTTDAKVDEAATVASSEGGESYLFTDQSTIGFVGSKVTGSHEGGFKEFDGHFVLKDGVPAAGEFVIDMASTWSDDEKLTGHLKSEDFFNVEKFPETTFLVSSFTKKSEGQYNVSGNLTLHGVTKNITFPATVAQGEETIKVTSEFDINRHDFGIEYAGKPDDLIRKEVVIKFSLEAKSKAMFDKR